MKQKILGLVSNLKRSSSSEPGLVPTRVVTSIIPATVTPPAKLINRSFERQLFPKSLKSARIIFIHKGGSKSDPSKYRPISLLSIFSLNDVMHSINKIAEFSTHQLFIEHNFCWKA